MTTHTDETTTAKEDTTVTTNTEQPGTDLEQLIADAVRVHFDGAVPVTIANPAGHVRPPAELPAVRVRQDGPATYDTRTGQVSGYVEAVVYDRPDGATSVRINDLQTNTKGKVRPALRTLPSGYLDTVAYGGHTPTATLPGAEAHPLRVHVKVAWPAVPVLAKVDDRIPDRVGEHIVDTATAPGVYDPEVGVRMGGSGWAGGKDSGISGEGSGHVVTSSVDGEHRLTTFEVSVETWPTSRHGAETYPRDFRKRTLERLLSEEVGETVNGLGRVQSCEITRTGATERQGYGVTARMVALSRIPDAA